MLERLRRVGIDPLPLDLPGHGARAGAVGEDDLTLEATVESILSAAPQAFHLVGYSMGGRIALHVALRAPHRVRRLVLESASPGLETEEERQARRRADADLARSIVEDGMEAFLRRWEALPLFSSQTRLPSEVRARHRAGRLANDPRSLAAALRGLGTGALPSLWSRLGEIEVPTLLVVGERDGKFVEIGRRMQGLLPLARFEVVEDAGHTVHLERPEAWVKAVGAFLAGST